MRTRVLAVTLALILSLGLLSGCSNDNDSERQRLVADVEIVNGGVPVIAAWIEDGGDGIIPSSDDSRPVDVVEVLFRARPYSYGTMTIPEDDVYSSVIITGYNLYWETDYNAPAGLDMSQFNITNGAFYMKVAVGEDAISAVMITTLPMKDAIAAQLGNPWPTTSDFTANARLEFIAHETGSQHEYTIDSGVYVHFTYAVASD